MSLKEISQLITNNELKIIDYCEDMSNYQNNCTSYLSSVQYIYYMRLLDRAYDKLFYEKL